MSRLGAEVSILCPFSRNESILSAHDITCFSLFDCDGHLCLGAYDVAGIYLALSRFPRMHGRELWQSSKGPSSNPEFHLWPEILQGGELFAMTKENWTVIFVRHRVRLVGLGDPGYAIVHSI
jgi:hypothetical protein